MKLLLIAAGGILSSQGSPAYSIPNGWRCKAGRFTTMAFYNEAFHLKCVDCPTGKYQPRGSQMPCLFCPRGKVSLKNKEACWDKGAAGQQRCVPGKYGPTNSDASQCKACAAGRYGVGGSLTPSCSGLCRAGRYGKGGSFSVDCDAPCNALVMCGPGATTPTDGGACPKGRYQLDERQVKGNWHRRCPLIAPLEFRPKAGYASAWGEQAACVLDKSMRFIEVLYALKKCRIWEDNKPANICYEGLLPDLAAAFRSCCEGSEHVPFRKTLARCKGMIMPITRQIESELDPLLAKKMATNDNDSQGADATFADDQQAVLPAFQQGIEIAKLMYNKDVSKLTDPESHPFGDLTPAAAHMLNICRHTNCEDAAAIQTHIERYYCSFFNCAVDAKLESRAAKDIAAKEKKGVMKKVKTVHEAPASAAMLSAIGANGHVDEAVAGHYQDMQLAKKHQTHQKFDWSAFTTSNFHHSGSLKMPKSFASPGSNSGNVMPEAGSDDDDTPTPAPSPSFGSDATIGDANADTEENGASLWRPGQPLSAVTDHQMPDYDGSITREALQKQAAKQAAQNAIRRRRAPTYMPPTPKPTFGAYEIGMEGKKTKAGDKKVSADDDDLVPKDAGKKGQS